jgi:hypothetical protein
VDRRIGELRLEIGVLGDERLDRLEHCVSWPLRGCIDGALRALSGAATRADGPGLAPDVDAKLFG